MTKPDEPRRINKYLFDTPSSEDGAVGFGEWTRKNLPGMTEGTMTFSSDALPVHWADEIRLTDMGNINSTGVIGMKFDGKWVCVQLGRDGVETFRDQLTDWLNFGWTP